MIDRPLRRVSFILLCCFGVLFAQLNRIQVFEAEALRDHEANTRTVQRDLRRPRGPIVTADNVVVARSIEVDGPYGIQREYPEGDLYAHVAGYLSFTVGAEGVERAYNDELVGNTPALELSSIAGALGGADTTGEVVLTLHDDLQRLARDQLAGRNGTVVVLDVSSGAVLAMYSGPAYDPNRLATQDGAQANAAFAELRDAEYNPLLAKAYREKYFPGSTFKLVTAGAALSSGRATLTEPEFALATSFVPALTTHEIANFGGSTCGGNLLEMLRVSCNSGISELGAHYVGPNEMSRTASSFGFNIVPPFDLPNAVASTFPTDYGEQLRDPSVEIPAGVFEDTPKLAQTSIGQNDVQATPLQMALVAAAIANDGTIPSPHVVSEVRNVQGRTVATIHPPNWQNAVSSDVAADLRTAMIEVVEHGTGAAAKISGLTVGGKTGTAQLGTDPPNSHAWFVAFAGREQSAPEIAVAVLVEAQTGASEQTGGRVAAPIASALIRAYFEIS